MVVVRVVLFFVFDAKEFQEHVPFLLVVFLIHGSNKRKVKKENTEPNSQKAPGSLTSTVMDVGAPCP